MTYDQRERQADLRLRAVVTHAETKALMRSPEPRARGLVPMPWREAARPSPLATGYIVGSKADAACAALGLSPSAPVERVFGTVCYVEGPKAVALADGARPRPNVAVSIGPRTYYREDFEADLRRSAGIVVMGEVD